MTQWHPIFCSFNFIRYLHISEMGVDAGLHDRRRRGETDRLPRQCGKRSRDRVYKLFVFCPSRHRYKNTIWTISTIEKFDKVLSLKSRNGGRCPRNGPTQRMSAPEIEMKKIMHEIIGRIFDLRNLLTDDRTLPFDFFFRKLLI